MPALSTLLDQRLIADPASPVITFYDDATGERVELSAATLANWVSKTCGLLVDGHNVHAGDPVGLWLPVHWQSAAILLACWRIGAEVRLGDDEPIGVAFAAAGVIDHARDIADEVIGLALAPMAGRLSETPVGVEDYAVEIPGHSDRWTGPHPPPDADAIHDGHASWSADELVARATVIPHAGQRVLTAAERWDLSCVVDSLLGPIATGGSVVFVRNPDDSATARRVETERVDSVLGR